MASLSQLYYNRQWMLATAGNLSLRDSHRSGFWITASGKHKGRVQPKDFVCVSLETGELVESAIPENRASAETSIHRSVYRALPTVGACLHIHTVASNLLQFRVTPEEKYKLAPIPPIEIIKAFGIWEERPSLQMAVFYNFTKVPQIAESISEFLTLHPDYRLPFVHVEEHGPTIWGKDLEEANRHLEAVTFLFEVMARKQ